MRKIDHRKMKEWNKRLIIGFLRREKTGWKKKIAQGSGLGMGTVNELVENLLGEGILRREAAVPAAGAGEARRAGRKEVPLTINPGCRHTLGCELTSGMLRLASLDYRMTLDWHRAVEPSAPARTGYVRELADVLKKTADHFPYRIHGIGIAVPGSVDSKRGIVIHAPWLGGMRGVPLRDILEDRTGLPVLVENNARCDGYAEWRLGRMRGCRNGIFIHCGQGVGGAIFVNGGLYAGASGMGGEIGHMSIDGSPGAAACSCGGRGCLERYLSVEEVLRSIRRLGKRQGWVCPAAGDASRCFVRVGEGARQGDPAVLAVLAEMADSLARGIGNLLNLFNPEMVVVGGPLAVLEKYLLRDVKGLLAGHAISEVRKGVKLAFSRMSREGTAAGAALMIMDKTDPYGRDRDGE